MTDLLANVERPPHERPRSVDDGVLESCARWTGSATSEVRYHATSARYWRERARAAEAKLAALVEAFAASRGAR